MKPMLYAITFIMLIGLVSGSLYDTTNLTAAEDLYEVTYALNSLLGGLIGVGLLLIVFTITFVATTANTGNGLSGLTAATFFTAISSILIAPLGFINYDIVWTSIMLFAISWVASALIAK